jgi:hypothetical protein
MKTLFISHDPFARTSIRRISFSTRIHRDLECRWCGAQPKVLFTYETVNDDGYRMFQPAMVRYFCNIDCKRAYDS